MFLKNKYVPNMLYIVFLIILLVWHFRMNTFGDDLYFKLYYDSLFLPDGSNFIYFRFMEWSWRFIIEFVITILCRWPILWVIGDSVLFCLLSYLIPRIVINDFNKLNLDNRFLYIIISIVLTVLFIFCNFSAIKSAGYIATTLNYTWPFILAILHVYIFKEYFYQKKNISTIKKYVLGFISVISLIFAINMEIVLISLLTAYLLFFLYKSIHGEKNNILSNFIDFIKTNKILLLYLAIIIVMLIIFIKCPGNKSRFLQESARVDFYSNIKLHNKLDISFTAIYCMLLTTFDLIILLFFSLLSYYSSKFSNNKLIKILLFIPPVFLGIFYILNLSTGINQFLFSFILSAFSPYGLFSHELNLRTIFIVLSYLINILFVIISLVLIYKNKAKLAFILFSLILISFISQIVIGFAPSCLIWTYPISDYPGRWWIIFNGIHLFSIVILLREIINDRNKQIND